MILINASSKDALKIFQPFLPIYVPVGLGFVAAVCDQKGIPVQIVDQQIEDDLIDEYVKGMKAPYIFGFSAFTVAMGSAVEMSLALKKKYPDSVILFGGIHPTSMPLETMQRHDHIDVVFKGEVEALIEELYYKLKRREPLGDMPSVLYRKENGEIQVNERGPIIDELDAIPSFPYHRFENPKYDLGFIVSSRGCPYKCTFCSNRVTTGLSYRYRNAEVIAQELQLLHDKYKRKNVLFLDDNFLVNRKRINELIAAVKARGLHEKMTFSFQARADNLREDQMKDLYEAGFKSVFFGVETASDRLMKVIQKGETVQDCVDAIKLSKKLGFHVSATYIFALPTETHADRMLCAKQANELEVDLVRFNNATPYPGTVLYHQVQQEGRLNIQGYYDNFNSVGAFIEPPWKKIPFTYIPVGESERQIRVDILWSYWQTYINWRRIKQLLTRPDQGVGWFDAGGNLMESFKKLPALLLLGFSLTIKFSEMFLNIAIVKMAGTQTYTERESDQIYLNPTEVDYLEQPKRAARKEKESV